MSTFFSPILLFAMGALLFFLIQKNDEKIKEIVYVDNAGMFSKMILKTQTQLNTLIIQLSELKKQ
jgi:ABC-2 type transport system permease protein